MEIKLNTFTAWMLQVLKLKNLKIPPPKLVVFFCNPNFYQQTPTSGDSLDDGHRRPRSELVECPGEYTLRHGKALEHSGGGSQLPFSGHARGDRKLQMLQRPLRTSSRATSCLEMKDPNVRPYHAHHECSDLSLIERGRASPNVRLIPYLVNGMNLRPNRTHRGPVATRRRKRNAPPEGVFSGVFGKHPHGRPCLLLLATCLLFP